MEVSKTAGAAPLGNRLGLPTNLCQSRDAIYTSPKLDSDVKGELEIAILVGGVEL